MRILVIGKYPPIEGGVSSHTYWLARGLGEKGNYVHVITNALRVEAEYRLDFPTHDSKVRREWVPSNVTFDSLRHESPRHIPYSEAFVTRLANEALKSIALHGADVIYAHYLEPYATAGFLVKQCTGLPFVVRHAGSDIFRLLKSPDFSLILGRVLQGADLVMLSRSLRPMARALRISERRTVPIPSPALHPAFSPEGEHFSLPFENNSDIPTIAYLGKAGSLKGILELIDAVGKMKREVRLLLVTDGEQLHKVTMAIEQSEVTKRRVHRMPFVGPWDVPAILRSVDMLAHLENQFPIPIHTPLQPYEGIATETPLLLSKEMADKMRMIFPEIASLSTVIENPRDVDSLASALDMALADVPALRAKAKKLRSEFINDWDAHISGYENVFKRARRLSRTRRFFRIFRTIL